MSDLVSKNYAGLRPFSLRSRRFPARQLALVALISCGFTTALDAGTLTVTNANDSGAGSLRQAILNAAAGDTINFSLPSGTTVITLTSDQLEIHENLTINGPGASLLSVVRGRATGQPLFNFRIFEIDGGNVTISGLTIANGLGAGGGGILNQSNGAVTITGCAISGNSSSQGSDGGGIATANGFNGVGEMTITNCTISGNSSQYGAGIANSGTLTIANSTVSGNSASLGGGGIHNDSSGTVTITSSTISGNSVTQATHRGGGITNTNVTDSNGTTLRNTIIAKNTAEGADPDVEGTFTSQGFNLIGNNSGATITPAQFSDQIGSTNAPIDPMLGPLQDNGGPTWTHALQPASPATDKGDSGGSTTDQRGFHRPVDSPNIANAAGGDGSDIGAYEDQLPCQTVVTNNSDSGPGSLRAVIASACTNATITFASSVVNPINLTSDELLISRPMTIAGPGANLLTVQRSGSAGTNFSIFHVSAGGYVIISGLTITKGNPNHLGGGIYVDNASNLFLENCAVTNNLAQTSGALMSNGGGIATGGIGSPSVTLISSTISGNSATQDGGGIAAASLTVDTSTIAGNTAARYGGGISVSGTTNIVNSTIANNSAATGGGVRESGSTTTVSNSIFAKNAATTTDPDFSGTLTSHGYNLIGNSTGTTITGTTTGNQLNVDPLLGPLQDNSGPTETCALLAGSPAIDQGQPYGISLADQRGAQRPYDDPNIPNAAGGNGSDIGAFEMQPSPTPTPTPTATATATLTATPKSTPTATPKATPTATATASATATAKPRATPTSTPKATATATPAATATPTAAPGLVANVSTRLPVGTGDNALIEGFIVQGPAGSTKKLIVRAIGPSLKPFGITDALADPTLGIFNSSNTQIASNDNWKTTQTGGIITSDQAGEINGSGLAPGDDLESAIVANLKPGAYTAVVRGAGNGVGTGVVDAFDLSTASTAHVANISTRGLIQPGDKLMIAGFIVQKGSVRVVVRAIGPSLKAFGINNALPDTTLQLRDQNGALVRENDDWMTDQKAELEATGLQPSDPKEAALVQTIPPGQYTAQVRGKPETTGIGVVQIYFLQ